jgi:hypothetical protein
MLLLHAALRVTNRHLNAGARILRGDAVETLCTGNLLHLYVNLRLAQQVAVRVEWRATGHAKRGTGRQRRGEPDRCSRTLRADAECVGRHALGHHLSACPLDSRLKWDPTELADWPDRMRPYSQRDVGSDWLCEARVRDMVVPCDVPTILDCTNPPCRPTL